MGAVTSDKFKGVEDWFLWFAGKIYQESGHKKSPIIYDRASCFFWVEDRI